MTFEIATPIDDGVIELGLSTADGTRIITVQNIDGDRPLLALEPGVHELRARIETTLLPGDFQIDVGLHRIIGLTLDHVERTLTFTALNVALEGNDRWPWNSVRGAVRPPSTWTVHAPVEAR